VFLSLKIAHISDVHIRNLKYHSEYRKVFDNLYEKLVELKPDIVINTGDTAHTKTQISPEFVQVASDHMRAVAELAPYHLILGNHDLNLMNPDRQDALTPIVESIGDPRISLHKKSGLGFSIDKDDQKYNFWVFSLADRENYPTPSAWAAHSEAANIGLFHGSVSTCVTDMNWRMTHVEHDLSIFDGLDYAFLGDIHKQQFFRNRTIAYPGSLIQQNFGEEVDKGFLLWDLDGKKSHKVRPFTLKGSRGFHTIRLADDLSIPSVEIEQGSRIRISPPRPITLVEQKEIEKEVKKLYQPHDIITLSSNNIGEQRIVVGKRTSDVENLRQIAVQEKLIRDFLKDKKLSDSVMSKILEMNRRYQINLDQEDTGARNVSWSINKLGWSNLFNYGEGNVLDFSRLGGLTGLFAPNGSGKSNFIDIILETCFDATTKGVNKNIFLINDNKEVATAIAEITANDQNYELTRHIEKIKYGQRSLDKVKEWGKTTVDFVMVDKDGGKEPLVGTSRSETEGNVRQRVGSFDDFMLTSLFAQWNPMDIIAAKETKRKEIIFRFLDLDIFGQKAIMAKDESRSYVEKLEELEDDGLENSVKNYRLSTKMRKDEIKEREDSLTVMLSAIGELDEVIVSFSGQKLKIDRRELGDWAGNIKKADSEIEANSKKLGEVGERLGVVETELGKVLRLESKFDLKTHEEKETTLQGVLQKIRDVEGESRDLNLELQTIQEAAKELGEVTCPNCQTVVKALDSSQKIQLIHSKLAKLTVERAVALTQRDDLVPDVERLKTYRQFIGEKDSLISRKDNLRLQVENLKLKIVNLQAEKNKALDDKARFEQMELDIIKNDKLDEKILELQRQRRAASLTAQESQSKIVELVRILGSEQGILEKLETTLAQLAEVRETCLAYEHYINVMGKDGIPYQVLTQKLPLINEEINKILANVADFGVFLEHDVEEQSIRFFIQYGQYKSRLLELGSGAEKFLASIAIRNALLNISILPKTNMLIIDEGFGKLDPKNLESIQRMFDYLRTVFDHIIVISHLDSMKDMVDNMIEITTDDEGYAHIEVGG